MSCCPATYWCTPDGPVAGDADGYGVTHPPDGATAGPFATYEEASEECSPPSSDFVQVPCCPDQDIPTVLHAHFDDGPCAGRSYDITWNQARLSWSVQVPVDPENSSEFFYIDFFCIGTGAGPGAELTWFVRYGNGLTDFGDPYVYGSTSWVGGCNPLALTFLMYVTGFNQPCGPTNTTHVTIVE